VSEIVVVPTSHNHESRHRRRAWKDPAGDAARTYLTLRIAHYVWKGGQWVAARGRGLLAQASHALAPSRGLLTVLAFGSVALAWMSVHTVYVLRYARLDYSPPDRGIDFHGDTPDYLDFACLGLTIGMTFQVSDTDLTGKRVRRTALHHALRSYIFGTVILAITVSSVAALLGR
jgi:Protein of unknown function (DUF1345)